jgi:hypothetical protein
VPRYIPPAPNVDPMTCPLCGTLADQDWRLLYSLPIWSSADNAAHFTKVKDTLRCRCNACKGYSLWVGDRMADPPATAGPPPPEEMPDPVRELYEEARAVATVSPRAAAALLRVALERLTAHLGHGDKKLNDAIGALVAEGRLAPDLQQAMDALRVTGNDASHPGEVRLDDEAGGVQALFEIVNVLVERLVSIPTRISKIYDALPPAKRQQIEERDAREDGS